MIKKNELSTMFDDYAILLERQTEGFSRDDLIEILESVSKSDDLQVPDIILGDDLKSLYFKDKYLGTITLITTEGLRDLRDYFEYMRTGLLKIELRSEK